MNDPLSQNQASLIDLHSGDENQILQLYQAYRKTPYTPEKLQTILRDCLSLGLSIDGQLSGFAYFEPFAPDIIELGNIFISNRWRNRGLGSVLIRAMEDRARQENYAAIILTNSLGYETLEPKQSARNFYTRAGYEPVLCTEQSQVFIKGLTPLRK